MTGDGPPDWATNAFLFMGGNVAIWKGDREYEMRPMPDIDQRAGDPYAC